LPIPGVNRSAGADIRYPEQRQTFITYTDNRVANQPQQPDWYRIGVPVAACTYEITGIAATGTAPFKPFTLEVIRQHIAAATEIPYEQVASAGVQKRLIECSRSLYRTNATANSLTPTPLPLGQLESLALPYGSYELIFTPGLITQVYQRRVDERLLREGRYVKTADLQAQQLFPAGEPGGGWWIPSGRQAFDPDQFFLPVQTQDPFGQVATVVYDRHRLLPVKTIDPLQNAVQIKNNYRVMQPQQITDPNGNRDQVVFDALGLVAGTAVMGKAPPALPEGDSLAGFTPDLTPAEINHFLADPLGRAAESLGTATTRIIYDLERYRQSEQPVYAATLARETHVSDLQPGQASKVQVSFLYSDGFGRELQTKIQAEPGLAPGRDANGVLKCNENLVPTNPRWVGTGRKIYNNKGKPVKQYEPFFSPTHGYEDELDLVECGVTPILFYDPLERVVATLHPNKTYEKVVFDPWQQATWDVNDTVALDPSIDDDVKGFFVDAEGHERLPKTKYAPTWYNRCQSGSPEAQRAARITLEAQKTDRIEKRYGTPTVAHLDTLGRPFLTVADNGIAADGTRQLYPTHVTLDIEGNPRWITDARGNRVMTYGYDLSGPDEDEEGEADDSHRIYLKSMDAGERWTLKNVAGNLMREWDSRGFEVQQAYDVLQRPTQLIVQAETPKLDAQGQPLEPPQTEVKRILAERLVYGEGHPEATQRNLIGQVYHQYDGAGVVTQADYDFKGNVTTSSRQLARAYKTRVDWAALGMATDLSRQEGKANTAAIAAAAAALLETEPPFTTRTTYDALNRPTQIVSPDHSVTCPVYNEANLLEKIRVNLRGATTTTEPPAPIWTTLVENINYNAKGQREGIAYGNGVTTTYGYDPETFRLTQLTTVRANGGEPLQDLHYTYDPVGNITEIRDDARQTIFFNNAVVSPSSQYEYDALYRLIRADGREHLGQTGGRINAPQPTRDTDIPRVNLPHPGNGQAMGRYRQDYAYDPVGNILEMIHRGTNPAQPLWRRCYQYALDSNRLLSTGYQSDPRMGCPDENRYAAAPVYPDRYGYDAHGNMVKMPHLERMTWDFEDQLQSTARQVVNNGGTPETTYYTYDAGGQRVWKVTERQAAAGETPTRMKERIYLAGFELYREYDGNGTGVTLARETLHGMDDEQRIALVETKTIDTGNRDETPLLKPTIRYQLGNHLGSASLELDRDGAVISYEEYYPYGNTSYQGGRRVAEVSLKRYRYTGKERDEESGFYYHGARYYACWLGRWLSIDRAGPVDSTNLYIYAHNNPLKMIDLNGEQSEQADKLKSPMQTPQFSNKFLGTLSRDNIDPKNFQKPVDSRSNDSSKSNSQSFRNSKSAFSTEYVLNQIFNKTELKLRMRGLFKYATPLVLVNPFWNLSFLADKTSKMENHKLATSIMFTATLLETNRIAGGIFLGSTYLMKMNAHMIEATLELGKNFRFYWACEAGKLAGKWIAGNTAVLGILLGGMMAANHYSKGEYALSALNAMSALGNGVLLYALLTGTALGPLGWALILVSTSLMIGYQAIKEFGPKLTTEMERETTEIKRKIRTGSQELQTIYLRKTHFY
jgi:RHS repeat-associated protein